MISTIAQIAFFGVWAINYFWPFKGAGVIMAVSAAIIAIVLIIGSSKK